jgi:HPt (histidine-containing phosphotransfer) domain-containing protein
MRMLRNSLDDSRVGMQEPGAQVALDSQMVLAQVDGNLLLLQELVEMFLADAPRDIEEIREAIGQRDLSLLKTTVHSLRGTLGIFGPSAACEVARQLETLAESGCLAGADDVCSALETAMQPLQRAVAGLVRNAAGHNSHR